MVRRTEKVFLRVPALMVRETDRGEALVLQLEKGILTTELLGTEFLEEEPHNIFCLVR